jgi:hypothetical protein
MPNGAARAGSNRPTIRLRVSRCRAFPTASSPDEDGRARPGVGIGAFVLDLQLVQPRGPSSKDCRLPIQAACEARTLNPLMACERRAHAPCAPA